ncbi:MAG: hypothetical protein LBN30_10815 [Oscillospiraceae bacterium]|jgi:hypothetical protein|nr:hypothetical protein [Oscillospiraceae bacterium]
MSRKDLTHALAPMLALLLAACLIFLLTSRELNNNPYNSYALQTHRWLTGHLDLGQDYSHLELAHYAGRVYVSFPPFPSILLIPFSLVFGENTPDSLINIAVSLVGVLYAFMLCRRAGMADAPSAALTALVCVGSNCIMTNSVGWVWFFAQNIAFTATLMSFYYALTHGGKTRRAALSLFFLCCAMGSRPFQAVYLPAVLLLLYRGSGNGNEMSLGKFIPRLFKCAAPAIALGIVYMALNYARFGNPLEFGHNYLAEFRAALDGQFSLVYLARNLRDLVRLPNLRVNMFELPVFPTVAFWLFSPVFAVYAVAMLAALIRAIRGALRGANPREYVKTAAPQLLLLFGGMAHIVFLCMHRTLGGWHFGQRYTNDALPAVLLALALLAARLGQERQNTLAVMSMPLTLYGYALNLLGVINLLK